jgi:hypothetical protein
MVSALASVAKALGRPLETIAADPGELQPLLAGLTPAMVGHRPGRWKNILSLLSAALARVGIVRVQGRIRDKPSSAWLAILIGWTPAPAGISISGVLPATAPNRHRSRRGE